MSVAVVVPKGFGAAVVAAARGAGPKPELLFWFDPSRPFQLAMVKGALHGHVVAAVAPELDPQALAACAGLAAPYVAHDEIKAGGGWDGAAHAVGGMAVQFILMGAIEAAVATLTERQRGLWKRLRAAPLSRVTLLTSRILSGAIIAAMVLAWLFVFGRVTLGVKIAGSPLGFVLVAGSFALMASTLGVLVSTLGKTPQATRGVGIFVVLIAVMLGGAWFPSFLFPEWLQSVTQFVPTRWAVDGLDAMTWRALGLEAALLPAGVLLAAATIFGAIAVMRFRWDE
jgi:ABC-2 type transport system permease protein